MMRRNSSKTFTMAFAIVVILVLLIMLPALLNPTQVIEVTQCKLTSNSISSGEFTSITFTTQSNDKNAQHAVNVQFVGTTDQQIEFLLGDKPLDKFDGIPTFYFNQSPQSIYSQQINIRASLPIGYASATYTITVTFLVDGKQSQTQTMELTVKQ